MHSLVRACPLVGSWVFPSFEEQSAWVLKGYRRFFPPVRVVGRGSFRLYMLAAWFHHQLLLHIFKSSFYTEHCTQVVFHVSVVLCAVPLLGTILSTMAVSSPLRLLPRDFHYGSLHRATSLFVSLNSWFLSFSFRAIKGCSSSHPDGGEIFFFVPNCFLPDCFLGLSFVTRSECIFIPRRWSEGRSAFFLWGFSSPRVRPTSFFSKH